MGKKYVVVTGANGGIGKEVVKALENDYEVIALDLSSSNLDSKVHFIKCDLSNQDDINKIKDQILSLTSSLTGVFHLCGIFKFESAIEGSVDDMHKIINTNFFSVFALNQILIPLLEKKSKIIILTSEVARYSPQPFCAYYACSKKLLDSYADVLRRECNYLDLKVIKFQSGAIKTNLLSGVEKEYQQLVSSTEHFKNELTKLKYMMDNETSKQANPAMLAKKMVKVFNKKHTKINYRYKNSFALSFLNILPEKIQDTIYKLVIR